MGQIKTAFFLQAADAEIADIILLRRPLDDLLGHDGNAQAAAYHLLDGCRIAHTGDHIHVFKHRLPINQGLFHLLPGPRSVLPHDEGFIDEQLHRDGLSILVDPVYVRVRSDEYHLIVEHRLKAQAAVSLVAGKAELSPAGS